MFPISSDGVFEDPSIFFEQDRFLDDLLADIPSLEGNGNEHTENDVKKRPRKVEESSSSDLKKTAHKFTEKQRRKEMTALYASLRSLLPLQYIKGKRAISDHMHGAVNHINDTKKKIEELKRRRDGLRKARYVASAAIEAEIRSSSASDSPFCVEVNLFGDDELEILISSSLHEDGFPLSMVLADLLGRQLDVISCVSSRSDRRFLHKIHVEINGSTRIDISELQEGLVNLIKLA